RSGVPSTQLTLAMLQHAARQVLGSEVALSEAQFQQALDPAHFVQVRSGLGGVAPAATAALLDSAQAGIDDSTTWHAAALARLAVANERRGAATAAYAQ
ncbi:MAG TPA: hypothetical protein P5333_19730, partial [Caldilinea sp.]|nr:hypothetical protein [Caldilinea sp.]